MTNEIYNYQIWLYLYNYYCVIKFSKVTRYVRIRKANVWLCTINCKTKNIPVHSEVIYKPLFNRNINFKVKKFYTIEIHLIPIFHYFLLAPY